MQVPVPVNDFVMTYLEDLIKAVGWDMTILVPDFAENSCKSLFAKRCSAPAAVSHQGRC